jgi:hypothetical protein
VGTADGGTAVEIKGRGFRSYNNVLCRFGDKLGSGMMSTKAEVIDEGRISCITPSFTPSLLRASD